MNAVVTSLTWITVSRTPALIATTASLIENCTRRRKGPRTKSYATSLRATKLSHTLTPSIGIEPADKSYLCDQKQLIVHPTCAHRGVHTLSRSSIYVASSCAVQRYTRYHRAAGPSAVMGAHRQRLARSKVQLNHQHAATATTGTHTKMTRSTAVSRRLGRG